MKEHNHNNDINYNAVIEQCGLILYKKKAIGNKARLLYIIQAKSGRYDHQSIIIIKEINKDFIKINDSNDIESKLYEPDRLLYNQIKEYIIEANYEYR